MKEYKLAIALGICILIGLLIMSWNIAVGIVSL